MTAQNIKFVFQFFDALVLKKAHDDSFLVAPTESFSQRQIARIATVLCKERWSGSGVDKETVRMIVRESSEILVLFSKSRKKIVGIACFDVVNDSNRWIQEISLFCTNTKGYSRKLMDFVVQRYKERRVQSFVLQPNSEKLYNWYKKTWRSFERHIIKQLDEDKVYLKTTIADYDFIEEMRNVL